MRVYVDSSVILRIVLNAPGSLENWHEVEPQSIASVLTRVEVLRALDRLRVTGEIDVSDLTKRYGERLATRCVGSRWSTLRDRSFALRHSLFHSQSKRLMQST